jgi:cytidine deaminase
MMNDETRQKLVKTAIDAQKKAYAPYSNYAVGAALLTKSGKIFTGVNVENAVYPVTICAERTAVVKAVSEGEKEFEAIAVVTRDGGTPCGSCRQVMAEFGLEMVVLIADEKGNILYEVTVADLLPSAFGPANLQNN